MKYQQINHFLDLPVAAIACTAYWCSADIGTVATRGWQPHRSDRSPRHRLVIEGGNAAAFGAPVPYKAKISIDKPAMRCPPVAEPRRTRGGRRNGTGGTGGTGGSATTDNEAIGDGSVARVITCGGLY